MRFNCLKETNRGGNRQGACGPPHDQSSPSGLHRAEQSWNVARRPASTIGFSWFGLNNRVNIAVFYRIRKFRDENCGRKQFSRRAPRCSPPSGPELHCRPDRMPEHPDANKNDAATEDPPIVPGGREEKSTPAADPSFFTINFGNIPAFDYFCAQKIPLPSCLANSRQQSARSCFSPEAEIGRAHV